ncbi:MAG: acyl-CoA thioesterase [Bacteroidales bacterium]|nr:acyl-CoA thioesterase [Bacteroidales bacterium]MDD4603276.1 acyl-CoA thioesterase [Bacteroidales bacterium]
MAEKHTLLLTVRGYELDSYNHINNAVYLNYFEHARWEYFKALDLMPSLTESELSLVVTDIHIRYQREVKLFEELIVESSCFPEKPYLIFQQRIIKKSTNLPAARATTKLIFVDKEKMARDIPDGLLKRLK